MCSDVDEGNALYEDTRRTKGPSERTVASSERGEVRLRARVHALYIYMYLFVYLFI